jgi:hypothetical protein
MNFKITNENTTGKTLTARCGTDSEEKSRENLNW